MGVLFHINLLLKFHGWTHVHLWPNNCQIIGQLLERGWILLFFKRDSLFMNFAFDLFGKKCCRKFTWFSKLNIVFDWVTKILVDSFFVLIIWMWLGEGNSEILKIETLKYIWRRLIYSDLFWVLINHKRLCVRNFIYRKNFI